MSESKANYEKFHALDTEFDATVNRAVETLRNAMLMMKKTATEIDDLIRMADCEEHEAVLFNHAVYALARLALADMSTVRQLWGQVRQDDPNNTIPF